MRWFELRSNDPKSQNRDVGHPLQAMIVGLFSNAFSKGVILSGARQRGVEGSAVWDAGKSDKPQILRLRYSR
jgi:hypothetical protein